MAPPVRRNASLTVGPALYRHHSIERNTDQPPDRRAGLRLENRSSGLDRGYHLIEAIVMR
jgi:hypothetical protein